MTTPDRRRGAGPLDHALHVFRVPQYVNVLVRSRVGVVRAGSAITQAEEQEEFLGILTTRRDGIRERIRAFSGTDR